MVLTQTVEILESSPKMTLSSTVDTHEEISLKCYEEKAKEMLINKRRKP